MLILCSETLCECGECTIRDDSVNELGIPTSSNNAICKHWKRTGSCIFGNGCKFEHPIQSLTDGAPVISLRTSKSSSSTTKERRVVRKEGRASAFRRWLVSVFGVDYLNSNSGIVDVAGGKGELSFELLNLNGIQSTVVDRRSLDIRTLSFKLQSGYYHRNDVLNIYNTRDRSAITLAPQHICGYFEMRHTMKAVGKTIRTADAGERWPEDKQCTASSPTTETTHQCIECLYPMILESIQSFTQPSSVDAETSSLREPTPNSSDSDSVAQKTTTVAPEESPPLSYESARRVIRGCSIIVGMHPDQVSWRQLSLLLNILFDFILGCLKLIHGYASFFILCVRLRST